jgi:putative membrane protein
MLVSAAVIFGVAYFSHGLLMPEMPFVTALVVAVVLALVSAIIKPIVGLLALPITILTLGLFSLAINASMLWLAERIVGLASPGFWPTVLAAFVISAVTAVLTRLVESDDRR